MNNLPVGSFVFGDKAIYLSDVDKGIVLYKNVAPKSIHFNALPYWEKVGIASNDEELHKFISPDLIYSNNDCWVAIVYFMLDLESEQNMVV